MENLSAIRPVERRNVMDILADLGVDVSDWKNYSGPPAANPKYCYNWTFTKPDEFIVACLWFDDLMSDNDGNASCDLNIKMRVAQTAGKGAPVWTRRAAEFDENMRTAYTRGLPIRAIILEGSRRDNDDPDAAASRVSRRLLDPTPWAVVRYDYSTGALRLGRGSSPIASTEEDEADDLGFEGEQRRLYILHRRRERSLRLKKINAARYENSGVLKCEVPGCGFDFEARYGELGEGFAHVHHLMPLSHAPVDGRTISLKELAIVCANCHAMIHRGGKCRELNSLIPQPLAH